MKPKKVSKARRASKAKPAKTRPQRAPRAAEPMQVPLAAFDGGCHCGAIEFSFWTQLPPRRWPVSLCQCGFCRGHGARMSSDPDGEVRFRFMHPEYLRRYRFGLRTADFLVCKECGIYVGAVLLSGRGAQATINLNALREQPPGVAAGRAVDHDGESAEERRARRVRTWTPVNGPV